MEIDIAKIAQDRRAKAQLVVSTNKHGMLVVNGDSYSWTDDDKKATRFKSKEQIFEELTRLRLKLEYYSVVDMAD